jgi:hypothetical protein
LEQLNRWQEVAEARKVASPGRARHQEQKFHDSGLEIEAKTENPNT